MPSGGLVQRYLVTFSSDVIVQAPVWLHVSLLVVKEGKGPTLPLFIFCLSSDSIVCIVQFLLHSLLL